MAAYNVKGVGVYSHGIRVKTKEGVPAAPPKDVKVEALSSTTIKVMWKPPDPWMINGINQGYKLQAWKGLCLGVIFFYIEVMAICWYLRLIICIFVYNVYI